MKQVIRYKCDFCQKLATYIKTIEHHEEECMHNPQGRNCYICEFSYLGDYDDGNDYSGILRDQCICAYSEDIVSSIYRDGNLALECSMFCRGNGSYYSRTQEQAEEKLKKLTS